MTIEETLSGLSTIETMILAIVGGVLLTVSIYLLYKGVKIMKDRVWRPKDKTKPRRLYICTVCGIPFSTQRGLVDHMWDVHKTRVVPTDANAKTIEVSYEEWEQVRLDEERKLEEFTAGQEQIDERVLSQLTGDLDNDPAQIIDPDKPIPPKEVYQNVSEQIEKPKVTTPSEELFNVQFKGDRILLDIAMTVPNTPEVIDAINKLNEAMGK
jgi:hypothetical protein